MGESQQHNNHNKPINSLGDIDNIASLWKRLGAALVDLFLVSFFVTPVLYSFDLDVIVQHPFNVPIEIAVQVLACEVVVFFGLNFFLLLMRGQTIGKVLFSIAIVNLANQKPAMLNLVINRYLIQLVMIIVPFLNLADVLLMFVRRDRRCLHDLLARTKVIDLKIPVNSDVKPNSFLA